jgi:hypothetical protein
MCGHKRDMHHAICRMQRKYRMQATCGMQPYTSARDSAWDTQAVFVIAVSVPLKCLQEFMEEQVALDALTFARSEDEIGLATKASFARLKVRRRNCALPSGRCCNGDAASMAEHATSCRVATRNSVHMQHAAYTMQRAEDHLHPCVSDSVKCTMRREYMHQTTRGQQCSTKRTSAHTMHDAAHCMRWLPCDADSAAKPKRSEIT